jgi:signal peptidase I
MEYFHSTPLPEPTPETGFRFRRFLWDVVTTIVPALVMALFINVFIAEAAEIEDGPSMQPNLYIGYRMMTEKVSYRFHEPRRGDIVIAEQPNEQPNLVKRVIGLPGETIESRDGHTFINGDPIDEPWVTNFGGRSYPPTEIPEGYVFIIGDNRPQSHDSRAIGPVPIDDIQGRVIFVYWPLNEFEIFP